MLGVAPLQDLLYIDEMDEWAKMGAVEVNYAFSKEKNRSAGCAYVSDRTVESKDDFFGIWRAGPRVYICGSRGFSGIWYAGAVRILKGGERFHRHPPAGDTKERFKRVM